MRRRAATLFVAALCFAACGAPGLTAAPPQSHAIGETSPTLAPPPIDLSGVPARVHVDAERATAAWSGSAGTSLSATAADGTTYRLDIPQDALPAKTAITMAPITSIDELGLTGGLAGAVYLQPAGLQLAATATLSITTPKTAPDGTRLAGFDIEDGGATNLIPASADGGTIAIAINHFSAPGAAFGSSTDLALLVPVNSGRLSELMTELLTYDVLWDATDKALAKLKIIAAWGAVMDPELTKATDDGLLLMALADWRQFVFLLNLYERDGNEMLAVQDGLAYEGQFRDSTLLSFFNTGVIKLTQRIRDAIDGNKALCVQSHDLNALANTWFWARVGQRYDPNDPSWLERAAGCAEIVLPVANLPTNLAAGGSDSANLQFALEFSDGSQVIESFEVRLTGGKLTFRNGQQDLTAVQGASASLTEPISSQQDPPYELGAKACWLRGGLVEPFCSDTFSLAFGAGPSQPQSTPAVGSGAPPTLAGDYVISVVCNSLQYGLGSGRITQDGDQVSMSWSVTLNPDRDQATADRLCWGPFISNVMPTSGSLSGTAAVVDGVRTILLSTVAAGPCLEPQRPSPTSVRIALSWDLPVGGCVGPGTPIHYRASRVGP